MPEKYEVIAVDNLIKMHQRNCNQLLISSSICVAIIGMNFTLWAFGHPMNTISAMSTGCLIFTLIYSFVMWKMERLDLRLEKERKAFYKRIDIEEQKHMRDM